MNNLTKDDLHLMHLILTCFKEPEIDKLSQKVKNIIENFNDKNPSEITIINWRDVP